MGVLWRRVSEAVRQAIEPMLSGVREQTGDYNFIATSNQRNEAMYRDAVDFSINVQTLEQDLVAMERHLTGQFTHLQEIMQRPLPRTWDVVFDSETQEDKLVAQGDAGGTIGQNVDVERLREAMEGMRARMQGEVFTPLQSWMGVFRRVQTDMKRLEAVRLELDSRRRTVESLQMRLQQQRDKSMRLPMGPGQGSSVMPGAGARLMHRYYPDAAEANMPPDARLARQIHETESAKLRKEGKLRATLKQYQEQEEKVYHSLHTLILDATRLREYAACSIGHIKDCMSMAAAAFEGSLSPNPLMATAQFSSSFPVTAVGAGAGATAAANAAGATATAVITAGSAAADKYKGSQAQGQWQAQGQAQWQGQEQGAGQGQGRGQAQLQVQLGPGGAYGASQVPQYSSNGISQYDNPLAGQQYGSTGGGAAAEGAGAPAAAGEARGGRGAGAKYQGGQPAQQQAQAAGNGSGSYPQQQQQQQGSVRLGGADTEAPVAPASQAWAKPVPPASGAGGGSHASVRVRGAAGDGAGVGGRHGRGGGDRGSGGSKGAGEREWQQEGDRDSQPQLDHSGGRARLDQYLYQQAGSGVSGGGYNPTAESEAPKASSGYLAQQYVAVPSAPAGGYAGGYGGARYDAVDAAGQGGYDTYGAPPYRSPSKAVAQGRAY